MKNIKQFNSDLRSKIKSNVMYLINRDTKQKLNNFMKWIIGISILGAAILIAISGMVIWIILSQNVGRTDNPQVMAVYVSLFVLLIIDLICMACWLAIMILTIVVSRKASGPISGKRMNIVYLTHLSTFVAMGIAVIVLGCLFVFGFATDLNQRYAIVVAIVVLECVRCALMISIFVTACYYRHILKKYYKVKK